MELNLHSNITSYLAYQLSVTQTTPLTHPLLWLTTLLALTW